MNVAEFLVGLDDAERDLATGLRVVADGHGAEPDVATTCTALAEQCDGHRATLRPVRERYGETPGSAERNRIGTAVLDRARPGALGLLRDLQDLYALASFVQITWTLLRQGASALRDRELLEHVDACAAETATQLAWLRTRLSQAAPQALTVAAP